MYALRRVGADEGVASVEETSLGLSFKSEFPGIQSALMARVSCCVRGR